MNNQDCFITDIYISKVNPNKICINWHDRLNPFFGSIGIIIDDNKVVIDSEYKNRDFVKGILNSLVDMAEFTDEPTKSTNSTVT